jgi:hypothetical protein
MHRHDLAEILLKVTLSTIKPNQTWWEKKWFGSRGEHRLSLKVKWSALSYID